jgi:hypothetical protein
MAKVNMAAVKVQVAKDSGKAGLSAARERATQVFESAVAGLQEDFETHAVTAEIEGGITSENISHTLGGSQYAPKNLYSFIGFPAGSNPTEEIREALSVDSPVGPAIRYVRKEVSKGNARYRFEISAPNKQAIYKRTPMPWASGLSWAQKVETEIPGFAHFLARFMGEPSRSGGGIQAKDRNGRLVTVREDSYTPPEGGYLTGIFNRFLAQVKGYAKGGLRRRF